MCEAVINLLSEYYRAPKVLLARRLGEVIGSDQAAIKALSGCYRIVIDNGLFRFRHSPLRGLIRAFARLVGRESIRGTPR